MRSPPAKKNNWKDFLSSKDVNDVRNCRTMAVLVLINAADDIPALLDIARSNASIGLLTIATGFPLQINLLHNIDSVGSTIDELPQVQVAQG